MARIVFDLDGTLIDSAADIQAVANDLLAAEGHAPLTIAETHSFIGNGIHVFVEKMCASRGLEKSTLEPLIESFLAQYNTMHVLTKPYPGVIAALKLLGGQHRLGICTNKLITPTRNILNHLNMSQYFETAWGGDSLPTCKPDPAMLHAAFDALGEGPRIYVGDSEVDAETAKRARVPFLLYTQGYRKSPVENIPHTIPFDHFDQLPGLIDQLCQ